MAQYIRIAFRKRRICAYRHASGTVAAVVVGGAA